MATWKIYRIVKEEYEVEADTREEALLNPIDPGQVSIIKETCVKVKDN